MSSDTVDLRLAAGSGLKAVAALSSARKSTESPSSHSGTVHPPKWDAVADQDELLAMDADIDRIRRRREQF